MDIWLTILNLKNLIINKNIDLSEIKCDKCKINSKSNTFNIEFFICNECKMNLCPLCKSTHDKSHFTIN